MLKIGTIIDNRYRVIDVIGRGGTSCVYLVENLCLNNKWAIKEVVFCKDCIKKAKYGLQLYG